MKTKIIIAAILGALSMQAEEKTSNATVAISDNHRKYIPTNQTAEVYFQKRINAEMRQKEDAEFAVKFRKLPAEKRKEVMALIDSK